MRPRPFGPRARNWLIASGVIGVLLLGGADLVAAAHGVDRVEVHGQGGVQGVVGLVAFLDARDAEAGGVVARVEHDAGERLLANRGDQPGCEQSQLFGDQEWVSAPAHVQHPVVVQVEAGLEAVLRAQNLQRQPGGHDLGDRGRNERLVNVLGHQLVAIGVHHEHQPRRSQRRHLLLDTGQGRSGRQEEGKKEQARPHGDSRVGSSRRPGSVQRNSLACARSLITHIAP